MDEIEAAWFAGLFEGEGSITRTARLTLARGARPSEVRYYYTLKISMTDEDVMRKISDVTGYQSLYGPHQPEGNRKPYWAWECQNRQEMVRILTAIRPHLGLRRGAKADEVLAWSAAKDAEASLRLIQCRKGHDLTVDNATYVDAKGTTMCRLCRNEDRRERNARRRATQDRAGVDARPGA